MLLISLVSILIKLLFPHPVVALSEFNLDKQIVYQVDNHGHTQVNQKISLQNNFSTIYAKQYNLVIQNQQISNIIAKDELGDILQSVEQQQDKTIVHLSFNQPSTNKTKTTDFTVSYKINDLVVKQGSIWKIDLPQHQSTPQDKNDITLKIPISMGKLAYSSIATSPTIEGDYQIINIPWQLSQKNISMAFGQTQLFNFSLDYYLKNDQDWSQLMSIPIPPDTASQTIIIDQIEPKPDNIIVDLDGNFLAQYNLDSHQTIDIIVRGQAQIHPPHQNFPQSPPQTHDTKPTQFWPSQDPTIKSISADLNSPQQIYQYVIDTLDYNFDLIRNAKRKSPIQSLAQPQNSLCTDFTDLFISLARANLIPSREIQGIVYTTNPKLQPQNISGDLLHAWPQFWNQQTKTWQSVDPTWQKTTNGTDYFNSIDLNHLALVIHSQDDQIPLSPGSYKLDPTQKSITINPTSTAADTTINQPIFSTHLSNLNIYNPNPNSLINLSISDKNKQIEENIPILPPFSTTTINLNQFKKISSGLPTNKTIQIDFQYNQDQFGTYQLQNPYHFKYFFISIATLTFCLSFGGIILLRKI